MRDAIGQGRQVRNVPAPRTTEQSPNQTHKRRRRQTDQGEEIKMDIVTSNKVQRIPYVTFKTRTGDDHVVGGCTFIGGEWKEVDTQEIFAGRRVVVFALPGAFTPTCSSQQLPGYEDLYDNIKADGIDEIYCLSVNDAFVMNAWFRDQKITKVKPIADGEGAFTQGMHMLVNKPKQGFGNRSWRYSMIVNDGLIEVLFEEKGKNSASDDNDPFEVSGAEHMLKYFKNRNIYKKKNAG